MGFDDLVRQGLQLADSLTTDLQDTVMHSTATGSSVNGITFGAPVSRKAIVEYKTRQVKSQEGTTEVEMAEIFFPRPVLMTGDDRIVLPDGRTGTILNIKGLSDPDTQNAYYQEVTLGDLKF